MSPPTPLSTDLLSRAQSGDQAAIGDLLEHYRPYLRILAQRSLSPELQRRVGASDIVQQTCIAAMKGIRKADFDDIDRFLAWLRTVHQHQIVDLIRHHTEANRRAVSREQDASADHDIALFASTPSQRLMAAENAADLARAMEKLPENQREAIRLKYIEGITVAETAKALGSTKYAVVGLLNRGMTNLRQLLRPEHESND